MKLKEFKDLKNKEIKELLKISDEKKVLLRKVILEIKSGSEKNLKKAHNLKKEIAKILTLIKEKEIIQKIVSEEKKEEK